MQITAAELARRLGGEVAGDGEAVLTGAAPADAAGPGDVTFAENEKYLRLAEAGRAAAVLVGRRYASPKTLIVVSPVRVAMARTLALFYPEPEFPPGVHPSAVIEPDAVIDPTAYIGPHCVVGRGARIGPRCALEGGVHVGAECRLGEACRLFPRVVLYPRTRLGNRVRIHAGAVIGADGYGYVFHEGAHVKIPQVGWVEIGDDVEIGANVTIDRGAMGPTVVGAGTKIDNLVQ
ncbi:MAG: UDP-3-O-(3-hydroxymyristoyl)glucosamine N-acyltransferase, partial [Verrucomicrobia bacterium]|nr:UDP-3-O-(3-hydroxymyristoyl)glucosamine N-acyltransferase [Verrucomicrobiota bacterium]